MAFDSTKYVLGSLCKYHHEWDGTGQSLRYINSKKCFECSRVYGRNWKRKNKARRSEQRKLLAANNPEKYQSLLDKSKMYYQEHKEALLIKAHEYRRQENVREKIGLYNRDYWKNNKEEIEKHRLEREQNDVVKKRKQQYGKEYRLLNLEQIKKRRSNYRKTEQGRLKANIANRRRESKKLAVHGVKYDLNDLLNRWEQFDNECAYCGNKTKLTIDHVIPVSAGGTDVISNIVPSCLRCNCSKHNKAVKQWYFPQPFFDKKRWRKIEKIVGIHVCNGQLSLF